MGIQSKESKAQRKEILNAEIKAKQGRINAQRKANRLAQAEADKNKYGCYDPESETYRTLKDKYIRKKCQAKHEFTIQFGDIDWPSHCPALGMKLDYYAETRAENSPSFDRIDSHLGYVKGNVKIVSWRANRIKNDGNALEHRQIADYIDGCSGSTPNGGIVEGS